ncbi:Arrestin domain-containing protein A [Diplonema papillatum]|nr:Arrestin domain-containing protein A [Diplonema papillatum]|eukprot:gene4043-6279_t
MADSAGLSEGTNAHDSFYDQFLFDAPEGGGAAARGRAGSVSPAARRPRARRDSQPGERAAPSASSSASRLVSPPPANSRPTPAPGLRRADSLTSPAAAGARPGERATPSASSSASRLVSPPPANSRTPTAGLRRADSLLSPVADARHRTAGPHDAGWRRVQSIDMLEALLQGGGDGAPAAGEEGGGPSQQLDPGAAAGPEVHTGLRRRVQSIDMLEALLGNGDGQAEKPDESEEPAAYASILEQSDSGMFGSAWCAAEAAAQHAECAVCFEPLCNGTSVVFVDSNRVRICRHYFHEACVKDLRPDTASIYRCPLCRKSFSIIVRMPDPRTDAATWFDLAGVTEGRLTKVEVREVLLSTVNTDAEVLGTVVNAKWADWCTMTGDGAEGAEEVILWNTQGAEELLEFVRMNVPGRRLKPPPDITLDRGAWFEFFDHEGRGVLSEGAVSRGIIKSCPGQNSARNIAAMVREVFDLFATTRSRTPSSTRGEQWIPATISKHDFVKPEGLADAIIAALQHAGVPLSTYQDEEDRELAAALQNTETTDVLSVAPWECRVCTFLNGCDVEKCAVCNTKRKKVKTLFENPDCPNEEEEEEEDLPEREQLEQYNMLHSSRAHAPPGQMPEVRRGGWPCRVCTYFNTEVAEECAVCLNRRVARPGDPAVRVRGVPQRAAFAAARPAAASPPTAPAVVAPATSARGVQAPTPPPHDPAPPPPPPAVRYPAPALWEPDVASDACRACGAKFSLFLRRHHCRGCGALHCAQCSPMRPSSRYRVERMCAACSGIESC